MKKFYFIYPFDEIEASLFKDVNELEEITCIDANGKQINNKILKLIRKVHLSARINKIIKLPFRSMWYDFLDIGKDPDIDYYCFITGGALTCCNYRIINKMIAKSNVHINLILLDPFEATSPCPMAFKEAIKYIHYEKIYSYSKIDASKYGFEYMNQHIYSNSLINGLDSSVKNDLYFCGRLKRGRGNNVFQIAELMQEKGVNFRCEIMLGAAGKKDANVNKIAHIDNITYYKKFKKYREVLQASANSNCILEIVQSAEKNSTLRYMEAVMMNKKLLTNNKYVFGLSYYNPKYIKYFESLEDIDFEWIKNKENVDYKYKGDFSSKLFFEEQLNKIKSVE